jgi:hypothetical protein
MMPDLSSAPLAIQRLARWLDDEGAQLSVHSFDSPANQLLKAKMARGQVQVLVDRGQWFVELAPPGVDDYFDMAVWTSCLAGTDVTLELEPLDVQAAWLTKFLAGEISGECTISCLREARRRRAYGRMGLSG